ncbi:putative glycosyslhydrolase [Pedobacter sp. BAL39]|uniref:glycosyl hydrolase n=1 Tax=Pedobacter sp. BAL39 TaxID=391596 RepID=UPI000155A07C|nr:glycosyl hydrolase [Pedobacter sp. BAL39]EDM35122.1 putative glycosyslhydrolase [Pedobacter sp. BAL39]
MKTSSSLVCKSFRINILLLLFLTAVLIYGCSHELNPGASSTILLKAGFMNPPAQAKPGVYWYFMDGNLSRASMTADLESMKQAGIGNLIFLEVNVGVPRGKVDFLSEEWQDLFAHAVAECERLGIEMTLGIGPGWSGSGGPWVNAAQSMQHLVSSSVSVTHPHQGKIMLPQPRPANPYFGEGVFTDGLKQAWNDFYQDVAVLAYPTPRREGKLEDVAEKALYYRAPYTSVKNVKEYLPSRALYAAAVPGTVIDKDRIIDLSDRMLPDGTLNWEVPDGSWTIVRFGARNNGAITRPAPFPGLGFEADKFDTTAIRLHLDQYVGRLLGKIKKQSPGSVGGLKRLHMDSWEMGAQNWTGNFRQEFIKRRGYDPLPYYPVYNGSIVGNEEISERFLWDLRQTSQDLILEHHAGYVKSYAHQRGMSLSIEPYDMNPAADLELGAVADVPMSEFWSAGYGYNSVFSCIEATSIAHVNGIALHPAEAFTAENNEGWKQYPGSMKNQGDWAFANGINRFVFHTFQNQVLPDSLRPGMTMGPYGVHWDRNQTWWPMVGSYHSYLSRSQFLLQQGHHVADVLYLSPEGAPHVFRPPSSAMKGTDILPDRKGYNFDGCAPAQLYAATVKAGKISFPGGASYHLLVMPDVQTMTPRLLEKLRSLVDQGAVVVGNAPLKSPGLTDYPACDEAIKSITRALWGSNPKPAPEISAIPYKKGKIYAGEALYNKTNGLYPTYERTAAILKSMRLLPDFSSEGPLRYIHQASADWDLYFISNTTGEELYTNATFRSTKGAVPECWNAVNAEISKIKDFEKSEGSTSMALSFAPYESYFILFPKRATDGVEKIRTMTRLVEVKDTIKGAWEVWFDPKWKGPGKVVFPVLSDWSQHKDPGIKYYSGTAVYSKSFDYSPQAGKKNDVQYLDLGGVNCMARVKLNGRDLGILWTAPWRIEVTKDLRSGKNELEVEVVNLWPNRLIGDEQLPDDGIVNGQWPDWLKNGDRRNSGRVTFTTARHYSKNSPLLSSGLLGPVTLVRNLSVAGTEGNE